MCVQLLMTHVIVAHVITYSTCDIVARVIIEENSLVMHVPHGLRPNNVLQNSKIKILVYGVHGNCADIYRVEIMKQLFIM